MKIKKIIKIITGFMGFISFLMAVIQGILFLDDIGLLNLGSSKNALESVTGSAASDNEELEGVMAATDEEVWKGLTDGLLSARPEDENPENAQEIKEKVESMLVDIEVNARTWEIMESGQKNDASKKITIKVNKYLESFWKDFFNEMYELYGEGQDYRFLIDSIECYNTNSTESGGKGYKSAHAYGAAVDINFEYNNNKTWTQNDYEMWEADGKDLTDTYIAQKLKIIYPESIIVDTAHKYTLLWGGEWSSSKKSSMHFSFIGDRNFKG